MLLEKLLDSLELEVKAFAVCNVRLGRRLRFASAPSVSLHFVLSGTGSFESAKGRHRLAPGMLIVVPQMHEHWFESEGPIRSVLKADPAELGAGGAIAELVTDGEEAGLVLACGRVEVCRVGGAGLFDELKEPLLQDFSSSPAMSHVFETLLREQTAGGPGSSTMVTALMTECFVILLRELCGESDCSLPWLAAMEDERMARVLDRILARPEQSHSAESLAEVAGMSRSTFIKHFTKTFGRSAGEFLRETRLRAGARLLRTTDLPIKTIASRIGYSSRSHFSHVFNEQFGTPPADYRRSATG